MAANLSAETAYHALTKLYEEWYSCNVTLEAAKALQNDGSPDWDLFHDRRLRHAIAQLSLADARLKEYTNWFTETYKPTF